MKSSQERISQRKIECSQIVKTHSKSKLAKGKINRQVPQANQDDVGEGSQDQLKDINEVKTESEDKTTLYIDSIIRAESSQSCISQPKPLTQAQEEPNDNQKLAVNEERGIELLCNHELEQDGQRYDSDMNFKEELQIQDNYQMSHKPFLQLQSKRKESFDFKNQSCVFNIEHDFIDDVDESILQQIEYDDDCSLESDQLVKKHNHQRSYKEQKASNDLRCREMAPFERSLSSTNIALTTLQRYPFYYQHSNRWNCIFRNSQLINENPHGFALRPQNEEDDYQKPIINYQNFSFQQMDHKYQTPLPNAKQLSFANISTKIEKQDQGYQKKSLLENYDLFKKLVYSESKSSFAANSLLETNASDEIYNISQTAISNKRCQKAKAKKQKKKMELTSEEALNLQFTMDHPFLNTQIYEIKSLNSLTQFNKQLAHQRSQFSLMGKSQAFENSYRGDLIGYDGGNQQQVDDYAITGEFMQNTVRYIEEDQFKNELIQVLEFPNLNSVPAYHHHHHNHDNQQKAADHSHHHNDLLVQKKFKCSCKNNKCAQGYCDCLKNNEACDPEVCSCTTCENKVDNAFLRIESQQKKIKLPERDGCNCKKSRCQKKYCECRQAGFGCSDKCRCYDCLNKVQTTTQEIK